MRKGSAVAPNDLTQLRPLKRLRCEHVVPVRSSNCMLGTVGGEVENMVTNLHAQTCTLASDADVMRQRRALPEPPTSDAL